jgi:hypothetical protein
MNNLKIHHYQPAPMAPTTQKGGRGYRHKRGCGCRLCKKRGGMEPDEEYKDKKIEVMEEGFDPENLDNLESGYSLNPNVNQNVDLISISDELGDEIDEDIQIQLDDEDENDNYVIDVNDKTEEKEPISGGTRRRKYRKKSKKGVKGRKTRRHSRKVKKHGRRTHKRH